MRNFIEIHFFLTFAAKRKKIPRDLTKIKGFGGFGFDKSCLENQLFFRYTSKGYA